MDDPAKDVPETFILTGKKVVGIFSVTGIVLVVLVTRYNFRTYLTKENKIEND